MLQVIGGILAFFSVGIYNGIGKSGHRTLFYGDIYNLWDSWRNQCKTGSGPNCLDFNRNTLLVAGSQWCYCTFQGQDHRKNLPMAELYIMLSYDRVWHCYGDSGNYEIKLKKE